MSFISGLSSDNLKTHYKHYWIFFYVYHIDDVYILGISVLSIYFGYTLDSYFFTEVSAVRYFLYLPIHTVISKYWETALSHVRTWRDDLICLVYMAYIEVGGGWWVVVAGVGEGVKGWGYSPGSQPKQNHAFPENLTGRANIHIRIFWLPGFFKKWLGIQRISRLLGKFPGMLSSP